MRSPFGFLGGEGFEISIAGEFTFDGNRRLQKPLALDAQGGTPRAHHGTAWNSARKHHLRIRHERIEFAGV